LAASTLLHPSKPRRRSRPKTAAGENASPSNIGKVFPSSTRKAKTDRIFRDIAKHRAAAIRHDHCVDIECEAEGKVSDDELFYLQHNTKNAFDEMMLWARAVIITRPTTRRGLIHQARYLASLITEPEACGSGGPHLPDKMNGHPWWLVFLNHLASGLRKMAGELDPQEEGIGQ
jgi:hypothetical protein